MTISGLEAVSSTSSQLYASDEDVLGKDDFLTLLVAQLEYQDPLDPMDSTDFTAQLAEFSSLEQLTNVNDNLQYLLLYQASINNSQAVDFIGKTVKSSGDSISLVDGATDEIHFELAEDASEVVVYIYDFDGNPVRDLDGGSLAAGDQSMEWDGTDGDGEVLPDGAYFFEIVAMDAGGEEVENRTFVSGTVTGITFTEGVTYLLIGDKEVPVGDVIEVF